MHRVLNFSAEDLRCVRTWWLWKGICLIIVNNYTFSQLYYYHYHQNHRCPLSPKDSAKTLKRPNDLLKQIFTDFLICIPLWQDVRDFVAEGLADICLAHVLCKEALCLKLTHHNLDLPEKERQFLT